MTFGGSGGQFADICEGFCDLWGVRGVNFGDLWGVRGVNFADLSEGFCDLCGVRGSTLSTFVKDFVTFGGSGGRLCD